MENLLDIDFDGAAPASAQNPPAAGLSGLEGFAGTPQRVASPAVSNGTKGQATNFDDLMGLSNGNGAMDSQSQDILNGLAGLSMGGATQPPTAREQLAQMGGGSKSGATATNPNEDLLGLF